MVNKFEALVKAIFARVVTWEDMALGDIQMVRRDKIRKQ
jgi:hypothetical protein